MKRLAIFQSSEEEDNDYDRLPELDQNLSDSAPSEVVQLQHCYGLIWYIHFGNCIYFYIFYSEIAA